VQVIVDIISEETLEHRILCEHILEITNYIKKKHDYHSAIQLIHEYQITFETLVSTTQKLSLKELSKLGDLIIYQ
jgi:hypothetical protein